MSVAVLPQKSFFVIYFRCETLADGTGQLSQWRTCIADLDEQIEKIVAAEATKQQVYTILQSFEVLFDVLDNADKKLLIKELIEKIELYPREGRKQSGQWIKTIHFMFPMYYNDSNEPDCAVCFDKDGHFLPNGSTDESIVTLIRD